MKTSFTLHQLQDPKTAQAEKILGDCVHYGFCVSVCPTYELTRDENESPRGRIDLIKEMLESGGSPKPDTVQHVDQCLSCLSCMSTCAASVDYMHLVDIARVHIEKNFKRPLAERLLRGLVAMIIPNPSRMRIALRAAYLARPASALLPRRLRHLLALAPRSLPTERASMQEALFLPAEGPATKTVAIILGCAQQVLAPHLNDATIRILRRHGCNVVVPPMECCGALTLHMGKEKLALDAARTTIDALLALQKSYKLDAVVVNASGCGTTMKDYAHVMERVPSHAQPAASIGKLVKDISEILLDLGLQPPVRHTGLRVAYHDACSLQHGQKITNQPRQLLSKAGFDVADVPEKHFCCGSAGTYNMLQPDTAEALGKRKADHITSTGAHVACAGNLGCIEQLSHYSSMPLVHTVELLDWATGGPLPAALAGLPIPPAPPPPASAGLGSEVIAGNDDESFW